MAQDQNFNSSAVENTILNLLVASEKNYEYPSLQKEAVDVISANVAKIVYDTLKYKSIASSTKRCNILKFLNHVCQTGDFHLNKNNHKIYLKAYKNEACKINNSNVENLLHDALQEIGGHDTDLKSQVVDFYKRKNAKRKQRVKKLELVKQKDQEKLCLTLGIQISKSIFHYETSENLINDLLEENSENCAESNKDKNIQVNVSQDARKYREHQIKFCYALINFGDKDDVTILASILQKLSSYKSLLQFEVRCLIDLWLCSDDQKYLDVTKIITDDFPFIVEKTIIQFCLELVKLKDASEVSRYFANLETNPKIQKIRKVCAQNLGYYCKMKNLIYELYVFSYCNANVYRFSDYII